VTTLDIAIAVYRLAAAGGLERHAVRLAKALAAKGHIVTLYTTEAGQLGDGLTIAGVARRGRSNQGRMAAFADDFSARALGRHDLTVGFHKMPGIDVLFCCDWCFADRKMNLLARLLPRYRTMAALEAACFGPTSATRLLMLAEPQAQAYRDAFPQSAERMVVLPPTLDRRRIVDAPTEAESAAARASLGVAAGETAWLWIGLQPAVKGLDRAIRALALSPGARLFAVGADPARRATRQAAALARRLGCANRLTLTGSVDDAALKRLFTAADLLIHPARLDVTGTVIVEALGAGVPVIVTANCGYAPHVAAAGAGIVVPRDADAGQLAAAAGQDRATLARWSQSARDYVARTDLAGGIDAAVAEIEALAASRSRPKERA